ncbi:MAG: single-stranded-DNA-specific exonuclease RecJ [Candidatus Marinimicrobia bacterium]|nr:single-stranded-DNA-specific exonuclease RecJ [Candidatus Neomarinimicrobiota bacterium]
MDKVWTFPTLDEKSISSLSKETGLSDLIVSILLNRGIENLEQAKLFFNPEEEHFHDPFLLTDMSKAVEIIQRHIEQDNHILIYGDYDVDGTTATSIIYLTLRQMGARITYYIPVRSEGYGLSAGGIESANQVGVKLIITCDCGITAHSEIELAKSYGIDVIVTDHHEVVDQHPDALAVINPKRHDSTYPYRNLSGAGVALKLAQALKKNQNPDNWYSRELYDLAALGTAADIVPMTGENRVIVSLGLPEIHKAKRIGLRALLKSSGFRKQRMTVNDIVFLFGPRINAVGRLGEAREAVELFISNDMEQATKLAKKFERLNSERRVIDQKTYEEAEQQLLDRYNPDQLFGAVLYGDKWHQGVIGIVASRITEKYYRPSVMISLDDDVGRGSGRSIPGVNLHEALTECSDLLLGFGGHEQAGGLTIEKSKIQDFVDRFDDVIASQLSEDVMTPKITVEGVIKFKDIDKKLLEIVERLEPYGPGNKHPIFVSYGIESAYKPNIVGENHLKMKVKQGGVVWDAIGFNMAEDLTRVLNPPEEGLKIAYVIEENSWNGNTSIQLNLKDIQ